MLAYQPSLFLLIKDLHIRAILYHACQSQIAQDMPITKLRDANNFSPILLSSSHTQTIK